ASGRSRERLASPHCYGRGRHQRFSLWTPVRSQTNNPIARHTRIQYTSKGESEQEAQRYIRRIYIQPSRLTRAGDSSKPTPTSRKFRTLSSGLQYKILRQGAS